MSDIHTRGDLNLFRTLVAIAEEGTTTGAAKRLHVSQSAVSHALRRLREMLDDPVFVRNGRQLVLTAHGRSILPKVRQSLATLSGLTEKASTFDPMTSEMTFTCGFRDVVEFLALPALLAPLREAGSPLRFNSHRVATENLEEALLSGAMDAVVDLEYPVSDALASREVVREPLCVMVGPRHRCFSSGILTLEDFVESDHALVTLKYRERAYVDQRMHGIGARRNVVFNCEHYHAAAQVVAQTDLILTMPHAYASQLAALNGNRLFAVPFPCEPLPVRLYWRKDLTEEPYMQWLIEQLQAALQSAVGSKAPALSG